MEGCCLLTEIQRFEDFPLQGRPWLGKQGEVAAAGLLPTHTPPPMRMGTGSLPGARVWKLFPCSSVSGGVQHHVGHCIHSPHTSANGGFPCLYDFKGMGRNRKKVSVLHCLLGEGQSEDLPDVLGRSYQDTKKHFHATVQTQTLQPERKNPLSYRPVAYWKPSFPCRLYQ